MLSPISILPYQFSIFRLFIKFLALTLDQLSSTAIPHLHSPESIGALFSFNHSFLIYNLFLSPFTFLPFSSYFFCVLCFGSLYLCSYLSHYLFPNISEYLYTHVFVVSQYFKITSSTSPLQFAFHL